MKFFVIKKETLAFFFAVIFVLVTISAWFLLKAGDATVFNQQTNERIREIHMVTVEFKSNMTNGKEIAVYRWDPGTISLKKGEKVRLFINGVNGEEHPFYIEGTKIKGTVKKGKETIVHLRFEKAGTYRLICELHSDSAHNGPMIADIIVE
jgi:plastocyanin